MNERDFVEYLERLYKWDRNAIAITLFSDPDPLIQQKRILALKERAAVLGVSESEFNALYSEDIEKLNKGQ